MSCSVVKPLAILSSPHPAHILSAAGSEQRGEGSALGRVRHIKPLHAPDDGLL